jgi:hypothetical protein
MDHERFQAGVRVVLVVIAVPLAVYCLLTAIAWAWAFFSRLM